MSHAEAGERSGRPAVACASLLCAIACWASLASAAGDRQGNVPPGRYSAQLFDSINTYRVAHGLPELISAPRLAELALAHSQDMAKAGQLNHDGYRERATRSGSPMCVENVGWNYPSPDAQLKAWIASPGHNRNMLDSRVTMAGIGASNAYVTFIACR